GADHRAGAEPGGLADLGARVVEAGMLRLRGLMAVAPLGEDPTAAFARLAEVRAGFVGSYPEATWLSAGMSADLEAAITAGATHVRVGSAVLGSRPQVK
ncbi:MAG TPA: alanine racemase, partial [Solirubrobacterales bacterium]|nr:alanine racemase [Solirubrobacterales bacterium]